MVRDGLVHIFANTGIRPDVPKPKPGYSWKIVYIHHVRKTGPVVQTVQISNQFLFSCEDGSCHVDDCNSKHYWHERLQLYSRCTLGPAEAQQVRHLQPPPPASSSPTRSLFILSSTKMFTRELDCGCALNLLVIRSRHRHINQ